MRVEQQADAAVPWYFNSLLAMDAGEPSFYDKRHLVPFGEFFPVPQWVRHWLRLMSLPNEDFTRGRANQPPMMLAGQPVSVSICYEDAYPGQLRTATRNSTLLATVTNDAWFGRSGARYQHLQIARMLALQSRRYLLRAANDGVSAVVDPQGRVIRQAPEFEPAVLRGVVQPRSGATPYLRAGDWPVMALALATLLAVSLRHLKNRPWTRIKKH
jgi:apolipoprotein N-acyltransferase